MKRSIDWGAWGSLAIVAAVCAVIALRAMPGAEPPPETDGRVQEPATQAAPEKKSKHDLGGYRVNAPERVITLRDDMQEISGLGLAGDETTLWAIDDERSTLFRLSTEDGSIEQRIELKLRGDYESVEQVEDRVYVARSDGTLLIVDTSGKRPVEKLALSSELGLACELEGVAWDPERERLLLSCKNEPVKTKVSKKACEIYALDVEKKKVDPSPLFTLDEQAIDAYVAKHPPAPGVTPLKGSSFAPSGLALHPKTGELYVLSTRGKMLVVLSREGKLVDVGPLDPVTHPRPEGIAFGADGTLYLSDEAHGSTPARIHVIAAP